MYARVCSHGSGKSNGTYRASNMRSNQGFASAMCTFPMGAFMSCVYAATPATQRCEDENNWHPQYVGVEHSAEARALAEAAAAGRPLPPKHNTTGTKPLPIPFHMRPGFAEIGMIT